ncbi:hypothetical protein COV19_03015 [Candidatus Woesearchaeota archaeon CG10_big_fil_rev_8_21_14_0_10_44_13]|nr:MAG: hypothetical protein COV19_03015 [Candidatus Woesearchaeota archaeon CG10_big_fil_rev_8_21_14_0_10_44_13]
MHLLKKGDFGKFVESLISRHEVIAPVKTDIVRFKVLEKGDGAEGKVVFDSPLYSAKEFFLPIKEPFYYFKKGKICESMEDGKNARKRIFFMNRCDINGVHRNDLILLDDPVDPYYREKRDNAILVEIPCVQSKRCSCVDIGLIDCYDLRIIDPGQDNPNYVLDAATEKGRHMIKEMYLSASYLPKQDIPSHQARNIAAENKEVWEDYGKDCFSCSACTAVCPTCTCFTIDGFMKLNGEEGHLYRELASCQLPEFTKVAGGFVFRKDRGSRGKQRIHCKFQYFREKYGHNRCVGCGRCNEACPVSINIFEYFGRLK